jgi:hypothetical protein
MFKSVKNKYFRGVLSALVILLGLCLGFFLLVYLTVPAYKFKEPRPFSGEYLYNPYQDMNSDQWKKYHFHCHSHKYYGLTNGRKSKETAIDSVYQALGYDHYGISDYMHINPHGAEKEGFIPGYEHGYGFIRKTHQICIGAEKVWCIDYPFIQNLNMKQHTINKLGEQSRFVMPAHASFTKGYKVSDMKWLSNYRLLEIMNPYGNALEHWDMALSNGHRVYGLGDDDTHDITNIREVCHNMTMVNTPDLVPEHVYEALEKGNSYTVEFVNFFCFPMSLEEKIHEVRDLAYLTKAQLVSDTLFIETSAERMREVSFIGQGGKVLKTQEDVHTAFYVIQPEDSYVRTQIDLNLRDVLYLNPVTRHPSPTVVDRRLDEVNWAQTVLYWVVYAVAVLAFIWYLIKKAKDAN